jgi:protocatechuate 3,4-dioxygenase beta subunit
MENISLPDQPVLTLPPNIFGTKRAFSVFHLQNSTSTPKVSKMFDSTRRAFLQQTAMGLATVGASGLILRCDAQPTQQINRTPETNRNHADRVLIQMGPAQPVASPTGELKKITPLPYGPFYRAGAPFRGKLNLPGEPGTMFILSGRVWAFDTKRALPGAVLDFWHVDMQEKYSNGVSDFRNRGRLVTSETGSYELESIRPIPYRPNPTGAPDFWRCAHYHLVAVCPGYQPLVTEIHFQGDAKRSDPMYRVENAITVEDKKINGTSFQTGVFDIVLEPEPSQ